MRRTDCDPGENIKWYKNVFVRVDEKRVLAGSGYQNHGRGDLLSKQDLRGVKRRLAREETKLIAPVALHGRDEDMLIPTHPTLTWNSFSMASVVNIFQRPLLTL